MRSVAGAEGVGVKRRSHTVRRRMSTVKIEHIHFNGIVHITCHTAAHFDTEIDL